MQIYLVLLYQSSHYLFLLLSYDISSYFNIISATQKTTVWFRYLVDPGDMEKRYCAWYPMGSCLTAALREHPLWMSYKTKEASIPSRFGINMHPCFCSGEASRTLLSIQNILQYISKMGQIDSEAAVEVCNV